MQVDLYKGRKTVVVVVPPEISMCYSVIWQAYCGHLEAMSVIMNYTVNLDLQDNRGKFHMEWMSV